MARTKIADCGIVRLAAKSLCATLTRRGIACKVTPLKAAQRVGGTRRRNRRHPGTPRPRRRLRGIGGPPSSPRRLATVHILSVGKGRKRCPSRSADYLGWHGHHPPSRPSLDAVKVRSRPGEALSPPRATEGADLLLVMGRPTATPVERNIFGGRETAQLVARASCRAAIPH